MDNQNIHGLDAMLHKLHELEEYLANDVKTVIGVEAVKVSKNSFQKESFDGNKWASRKTKRPGGTNGQKILTKSGELGDSIDFRIAGDTVIIYTDKDYGEIHNEGGEMLITPAQRRYFWAMHYNAKEGGDLELADQYKGLALAKKIKMPQRQFIGESDELIDKIITKLKRDVTRILS